jgi:hypothetical protein
LNFCFHVRSLLFLRNAREGGAARFAALLIRLA